MHVCICLLLIQTTLKVFFSGLGGLSCLFLRCLALLSFFSKRFEEVQKKIQQRRTCLKKKNLQELNETRLVADGSREKWSALHCREHFRTKSELRGEPLWDVSKTLESSCNDGETWIWYNTLKQSHFLSFWSPYFSFQLRVIHSCLCVCY